MHGRESFLHLFTRVVMFKGTEFFFCNRSQNTYHLHISAHMHSTQRPRHPCVSVNVNRYARLCEFLRIFFISEAMSPSDLTLKQILQLRGKDLKTVIKQRMEDDAALGNVFNKILMSREKFHDKTLNEPAKQLVTLRKRPTTNFTEK